MKIKIFKICLIVFSLISVNQMIAQGTGIAFGIGTGLTYGINEANSDDRTFGPEFNVLALWSNGLGDGLTPEFSFSYFKNGTKDNEIESRFGYIGPISGNIKGLSKYATTHINFDLRLRYYPLNEVYLGFYGFAGVGGLIYNVDEVPFNNYKEDWQKGLVGNFKFNGFTLNIPIGVGLTHYFTKNFAFDLSYSYNISLTDDLNPVHDDIIDSNHIIRISALYEINL